MCCLMSRPDGWRRILAGMTGYVLQTRYLFSCLFENLTAAVWQRMAVRQRLVMKRRATPSLVPLTNESRQRWSGSPLTLRVLPRWKKEKKKGDLLMLDRFSLHIHYWAGWWAEKCELPRGALWEPAAETPFGVDWKFSIRRAFFFFPSFLAQDHGLFTEGQASRPTALS